MAINLVREKDRHPVCFHCCGEDVIAHTVTKTLPLMRSRADTIEKPCGALL